MQAASWTRDLPFAHIGSQRRVRWRVLFRHRYPLHTPTRVRPSLCFRARPLAVCIDREQRRSSCHRPTHFLLWTSQFLSLLSWRLLPGYGSSMLGLTTYLALSSLSYLGASCAQLQATCPQSFGVYPSQPHWQSSRKSRPYGRNSSTDVSAPCRLTCRWRWWSIVNGFLPHALSCLNSRS